MYHCLCSSQEPTRSQWPVKPSMLDPYLPYLYRRWQDGCENAAQLVREIREQGDRGSRKMVAVWVGATAAKASKDRTAQVPRISRVFKPPSKPSRA